MTDHGVYIPSIDAKDLFLAEHAVSEYGNGYNLRQPDGQYRLRKFTNSFDNSLDLIQLTKLYQKVFRRKDFTFTKDQKKYTANLINVTFRYSVKEWNQTGTHTFVRLGCSPLPPDFHDCIARNETGEIVGIQTGKPVLCPADDLPKPYFTVQSSSDSANESPDSKAVPLIQYQKAKAPKTVLTSADLRVQLYQDGFTCNGIHYVRMKRSSGSARTGKCLFIREPLFRPLLKFSSGGVSLTEGQEVDLAAYEAYISLPTSGIIGTLPIRPEQILVIEDYHSIFTEEVIATRSEDGWLKTQKETAELANSIWDGQSLMDVSLFGPYSSYGMVLLRNLMFKSCCFNCNLQQWFRDHQITELSQLHGITRASSVEDIKLITTPSSIKYLKFDTLDHWFDHLYPEFGVVKHEKKTRFFDGKLVQTHYQLLNTLQLTADEMQEFLRPSLEFAQALRDRPEVVRYYIKYPDFDGIDPLEQPMLSKHDVVFHLLCINHAFAKTKYYQSFLTDLLRSYYKNLKNGHVFVHGNYATLLGNPIEMLKQSIGQFDGSPQMETGTIHSTRFEYGQTLLASRSPHVTMGNNWLPYNKENPQIDRYLNLTDEILCINSIGENVLQRLSGADFDSDAVMLTDNPVLIAAAKRNYDVFLTPTSLVSARKVIRTYTPAQQADLDIKTSVNLIGEIINLSQELNSLLWDRMYYGASYPDVEDLYYDICQLDVMSGIEIDKAKKEFEVDNKRELERIRKKYEPFLTDEENRKKTPHFFAHLARQKGYYNPEKKHYCKYHTSMDELHTIVNGFRIKNPYKKDWLPFSTILNRRVFRACNVNQAQVERICDLISKFITGRNLLFSSDLNKEDKWISYGLMWDALKAEITGETIGFSTLLHLLSSLEDETHTSIRHVLLELLFFCENKSFHKAVLQSVEELEVLYQDENGTEQFFEIPFSLCRKTAGFSNGIE